MDIYLLKQLDMAKLPRAVRGFLGRAMDEYRDGGICEMQALSFTAREISLDCGDSVGEAISLVFIGAAYCQRSQFDRAIEVLDLARAVFRRQPSWRQRRNEAIALYGMGLAHQRSAPGSVVAAVASFQKALNVLEDIRIHYVFDGDDRSTDATDELCAELRARIDAEIVSPIEDAEFTVVDLGAGQGEKTRVCQAKLGVSSNRVCVASSLSSGSADHTDRRSPRNLATTRDQR